MQDRAEKQTQSDDKAGGDGILPDKQIPDSVDVIRRRETETR